MPYGEGKMLGAGVDPRMFTQNYDGFANAAAIKAAGMLNFANQIGDAWGKRIDEQKKAKEALKVGASQIDAFKTMFPSQAPMLDGISAQIKDEDTPITQRAAIASHIADMISLGVGEKRYQQEQQRLSQDQSMRQMSANDQHMLHQQAYGATADELARQKHANELDQGMKTAIGPALLDNVINMMPKGIADAVKGQKYSPEEAYSISNTLMGLQKSSAQDAPKTVEVPVPGGSMMMQWNGSAWGPVQTTIGGGQTSQVDKTLLPEGLQPYAQTFNTIGAKYGVDPKALAAISMHETALGTSNAFTNKHNAMGVSDSKGPIDTGTVEASIERMAALLSAGAQGRGPYAGATTLGDVSSIYAPVGAENDPKGLNSSWLSGVSSHLKTLGGDPSRPIVTPPTMPVGFKPDKSHEITPQDQIAIAKFNEEQQAKQKSTSADIAESQQMIEALNALKNHPGFSNLFGTNIGIPTWVSGSDGANAKAMYEQIKGKGFLQAIQKMKGMGALSDKEGEAARNAYTTLSPSLSEDAARAEIDKLRKIVSDGITRMQSMGVQTQSPQGTVQSSPTAAPAQSGPTAADIAERIRRAKLGNH